MDQFVYRMGKLPSETAQDISRSFHTLQPSEYKDGAYRLRRYSKFGYQRSSGNINLHAGAQFIQSSELNRFQGDIARTYDDLTDETLASKGFAEMAAAFADYADLPENVEIEVHQIRIIAKTAAEAVEVAPEGVHQDGFDRIGIFTAARHNTEGGELYLWNNQHDKQTLAGCLPQAGDFCVLNDKTIWHSASAISAADPNEAGYLDLFVLTANRSS